MKYLKSIILTTLVLGMSLHGFAQQGRQNRPGPGQHGDIDRMFYRIPDMTDEQKEQIQTHRLENREAMLPIRNELNEKQARLRTLTTGDTPDVEAAVAVIEEIGALRTEQMKLQLEHRMAVRELLTDEQRVAFDTLPGRSGGVHGLRSMRRGPRGWN